MPGITYTALRSITRVQFESLSKTDVSTTISTFSSVAGDLLGLNSGEWVNVTGFTDIANNGWHQLNENSTASTITVTSTLVVEAAGNSVSIVGYLRGQEQPYSFDLGMQVDDRQRVPTKTVLKALAGNVETLTHRREEFFSVTTLPLNNAEYDQVIEFLDSVESDEIWTFDRTGSIAVPVNKLGARIEGNGYTEQRVGNAYRTFSFKLVLT